MKRKGRTEVHMDGLIFALQPHGGITRCFTNLLDRLDRRDDVVVTLYLPRHLRNVPRFTGTVRVRAYPPTPRFRPGRMFSRLNEGLERLAVERMWGKIDRGVFHSTHYSTYKSLKIPQILTLHDMIYELFPDCFEPWRSQRHIDEKVMCANGADVIVCPSASSLRDAGKFYSLDGKVSKVIPWAVDPLFRKISDRDCSDRFREKHTAGHPYLLYVGARYAHKNFTGLVAAYSRWHGRKAYRLLAVGGGAATCGELSVIRGLGVNGRVDFVTSLDDEGLVAAYNAAEAFIMPSLYEGFGFPVLEAMACGTPVATSDGGSLSEIGGDVPRYFNPQDGAEIMAALDGAVQLARDSETIRRGIRLAHEWTWDEVAEEYVRVYKSVAA
jgi:glycosyltransferase involved in cell wall biosynthesis